MSVISLPDIRHDRGGAKPSADCETSLETGTGRIQLTIYYDFKAIESQWREFKLAAICVPDQSFERAEAWSRLVSQPSGTLPAIVCGRSETGDIQFIWPFEVTRMRGMGCLQWIGQDHANYNMGLYALPFARNATPNDIKTLLSETARLIGDVSVVKFEKQPFQWDGVANPMALLPHAQSANMGHAILLDTDFDTLYRNRFSGKSRNTLRRKKRRLRKHGELEMGWAGTPEERRALLNQFFMQKKRQFAALGIPDAFSDPRIRAFYHEMAALPSGADGTLEAGYLKLDGKVIAISCCVFFKDRLSMLLTSIEAGAFSKYSPGSLLLRQQIESACCKGLNFFDMGAGDGRHKSEWCDIDTPLFENLIALDERGYLVTLPLAAETALKRYIKTRPRLWSLAQTIRRSVFGKRQAN